MVTKSTDNEVEEGVRFLRKELVRLARILDNQNVVVDKYGTIIEGTLKDSDIGPACIEWLKEHAPEAYQEVVREFSKEYDLSLNGVDKKFWVAVLQDPEYDNWFLFDMVYPTMHAQAPDGYYFGVHPDDGSNIGFHQIDEEVVVFTGEVKSVNRVAGDVKITVLVSGGWPEEERFLVTVTILPHTITELLDAATGRHQPRGLVCST